MKHLLIDKLILAKTEYTPDSFTGGSVQMSVSKYTKKMDMKLVLAEHSILMEHLMQPMMLKAMVRLLRRLAMSI